MTLTKDNKLNPRFFRTLSLFPIFKEERQACIHNRGVNGPLKFLTARKILPLLDLLAKFKRVLACSCSPNFCVARKLAKQIFSSARARKKIAVLGMLANARKDHSSPLTMFLFPQVTIVNEKETAIPTKCMLIIVEKQTDRSSLPAKDLNL